MPKKFDLASCLTDPEAEPRMVAALASRPEVYWEVLDYLRPEVFTEHCPDYEAVAAAIQEDIPVPPVNSIPAADPLETAERLFDLFQKRQIADIIAVSADRLRNNIPANKIIDDLESELVRVSQLVRRAKALQGVPLPDLLPGILADVASRCQAVHDGRSVGVPTGIKKLDMRLGGLQSGIHMLAAEPGAGKTSLCLQIGANAAWRGYPVIFVSFEESLDRLALKSICQVSDLEFKRLADGYGDIMQLREAAQEHSHKLANLRLVEGTGQLTTGRLKALALQAIHQIKSERCLIIIDYLQRWAASFRDAGDFRHIVSSLTSELRDLALRLNSPVLVVSSQNRQGQGEAKLTSLKESGDLEYSADTVLFLVEGKSEVSGPARAVNLKIAKNRYGDRGMVQLIFKPNIGVFREEERLR